jgi:hypothetical protein
MVALTKVGSKIIGPLSPKEFSDLSTLETTIDTAIQAVSDANASNSNAVLGTECITVLGNTFIVVLYQLA